MAKAIGIHHKHYKMAFIRRTSTNNQIIRFVNPITGEVFEQEVGFFASKTALMIEVEGDWAILGPPGHKNYEAMKQYCKNGIATPQFKEFWLYKHLSKTFGFAQAMAR